MAYALDDGDIPDGLCAQGRGDDGPSTVDRDEVEWITVVTQGIVDALVHCLPVEIEVAHFAWVGFVVMRRDRVRLRDGQGRGEKGKDTRADRREALHLV